MAPRSRQLEMDPNAKRMFEDFRLANSAPERVREVGVVGTAYDSILASDLTYVSTPITSGAILYKVLADTGVKTLDELKADKKFFFENVIKPNIDNADNVAHELLRTKGGAYIAPAAFEAKQLGWGQDDYMGLWYDVIEKKATRIAMLDGWEYSSGGTEEYLQALLMQAGRRDRANIEIINQRGDMISVPRAVTLLGKALEDLMNRNFEPVTTAIVLNRMIRLYEIIETEYDSGQAAESRNKPRAVGKEYFSTLGKPGAMDQALIDTGAVRTEMRRLIPADESSLETFDMAPSDSSVKQEGLVRTEDRDTLAKQRARVLTDDENKKKAKPKKGDKPEPK